MSLIPKSFHELLKMHFIIPPYQRGYRWDKQQVTDLLHDLHVFVRTYCVARCPLTKEEKLPYYCLQPFAVVKHSTQENTYYVVDGQQRITTIYLLLHFIKEQISFIHFPIYELTLPSRDLQNNYLKELTFKDKNANHNLNIDNFYLREAYKSIENWYDPKGEYVKELYLILMLFIEQPAQQEQIDVKVIWYEITNRSPLNAFRNLNYGKIPLTSTELVKALLLQGEETPIAGQHLRGAAYRRALEWDTMEHTLQNSTLWAMLVDDKDLSSSHIEIVLDFVADSLNEEMWESDKEMARQKGADVTKVKRLFERMNSNVLDQGKIQDNFNYHVIDEYLRRYGISAIENKIWREICTIYNLIKNWYDNREWYHLIGLYRIVQGEKNKKTRRDFIAKIYNFSTEKIKCSDGKEIRRPINRSVFTERLRKEIGNAIRITGNIKLCDLRYNDRNVDIIRILEAVNVKAAIDDTTENNRFAFDLFDKFKVTSLEHIHPQNITSDASFEDFKNWVDRRGEDFESLSITDFINIIRAKEEGNNLNEEILRQNAEQFKHNVAEAYHLLKRMTKTSNIYNNEANKEKITCAAKIFDSLFEEMAGITETELHSIKNMALVDKDTNSALQNYFLDGKRNILMRRHEACNPETGEGTYALPATRAVFCKKYSRENPGDMRLWRKVDRDNYFEEIKRVYLYFTE